MNRHLLVIMIVVSVALHAGLAWWLSLTVEPPVVIPPQPGKTSIRLRPATNQAQPTQQQVLRASLPPVPQRPTLPDEVKTAIVRPTKEHPPRPEPRQPILKAETALLPPPDLSELPKLPELTPDQLQPFQRPITQPRPNPMIDKLPHFEAVTEIAEITPRSSAASDASQGVDELPQKTPGNPAPPYPPDALAAGQEGKVVLRVKIDATGNVTSAEVQESSGVRSLDDSALTTVRRWTFIPAKRGGMAVPFEVLVPVRFSIRMRL